MIVRLLKRHEFHPGCVRERGTVIDLFREDAKRLIREGIAEDVNEVKTTKIKKNGK